MFVKTNTEVFNTRTRKDFLPYKFKKRTTGLDLERNMTNSVLLAFREILLALSHVVRVLRSALTFEQRDVMFF